MVVAMRAPPQLKTARNPTLNNPETVSVFTEFVGEVKILSALFFSNAYIALLTTHRMFRISL
jgi:hypothetical protein